MTATCGVGFAQPGSHVAPQRTAGAVPTDEEIPMSVIRYHPGQRLLQDEIKQVFDKFFNDGEGDASNVVTSQWTPRVDVKEEAQRFVIFADLPGVDPKDIEINMDKGILTIR